MNQNDFEHLVEDNHLRRKALLCVKGQDYADVDPLSNFKRLHSICKLLDVDVRRSPADVAVFFQIHKLCRKCNLRSKGKDPLNESLVDTHDDTVNYVDLEHALELDGCENSGSH
jgi:hypothetical protein